MKSHLCVYIVFGGLIMVWDDYYLWSIPLITIAFILFIWQNKISWKLLPLFGLANWITTLRLVLVLMVILASKNIITNESNILLLVVLIPLLDVIDGLVARQRKEESQFGMYYDLEVDALFVMVASIVIFNNHPSMWVVLLPAFLRYSYKFSLDIFDRKQKFVESKQKHASVIAGNYFVAIIIFNSFDHEFSRWYLSISSLLIIVSFLKSALEFARWKQSYDLSY